MRRSLVLIAALATFPAALLVAGTPSQTGPRPSPRIAPPTGTFILKSAAPLPEGIAQVTEGMPFLLQGLARQRLTDVNPTYRKVSLERKGEEVVIQFDGRAPMVLPLNRTLPWTREDGQTYFVRVEEKQSRLVQTYQAQDGQRTNEFIPDADGLVLQVTVQSPKLARTLKYRLVYAKQS